MRSTLEAAGYEPDGENGVWRRRDYHGIPYSDGDETERRIAAIVASATDLSLHSPELRAQCADWVTHYYLSPVRANTLRPFEPGLGGDVLEIGAGCGALTRYLGERGGRVLALEGSLRRAAIARSRTRDLPNVTVVAEEFRSFAPDMRFDAVTLIGVLEYAGQFIQAANPHLEMLRHVRGLLKPGGVLLVAIENQLGLKYLAGCPEDHLGLPMYGVEGRYRAGEPATFGRAALLEMIREAGFGRADDFYPFPDYKHPGVILTGQGLADRGFNAYNLIAHSAASDMQIAGNTTFCLDRAWKTLCRNGLAGELANSLLVACSDGATPHAPQDALAYVFSCGRTLEFCKTTRFVRQGGDIAVKRAFLAAPATPGPGEGCGYGHARQDDSRYIDGVPLSVEFIDIVTRTGWDMAEVAAFFTGYIRNVANIAWPGEEADEAALPGAVLPGHCFDAIPSNLLRDSGGGVHYIDVEWSKLGGVPLRTLLYRAYFSLVSGVSVFAKPEDEACSTSLGLLARLMAALGVEHTQNSLAEFLREEALFHAYSYGIPKRDPAASLEDRRLPGLFRLHEVEGLVNEIKALHAAKDFAETLAIDRLKEVERLDAQIRETLKAKDHAEALVYARDAELRRLRGEDS